MSVLLMPSEEMPLPSGSEAKPACFTAWFVPRSNGMSRPPEIALSQTASLTPEQQAFSRAAKRRLDFALPLDVWRDYQYSVLPSQRAKPVARSGTEQWYDYAQVVKRGVNPRSRRRVVVVTGGSMAAAAAGRR